MTRRRFVFPGLVALNRTNIAGTRHDMAGVWSYRRSGTPHGKALISADKVQRRGDRALPRDTQ